MTASLVCSGEQTLGDMDQAKLDCAQAVSLLDDHTHPSIRKLVYDISARLATRLGDKSRADAFMLRATELEETVESKHDSR